MKFSALAVMFIFGSCVGQCQDVSGPAMSPTDPHSGPVVSFAFEHPPLTPSRWSIEVLADGTGHYCVRSADPGACSSSTPIQVSSGTQKLLQSAAEAVRGGACESKAKNIAKTGRKTLAYDSRPGSMHSTCTFNYSDEPVLNNVASTFMAIANALQTGEKLRHEHRFDRLGLNAELDSLTAQAKEGRVMELQNIAPVLQSLVDDDDLMDVVRRKAKSLLQDASLLPRK